MGDIDGVSVQATATTFSVIEALRDRHRAGVTELATELGRSKSAVHNHLDTLVTLGYVRRTEEGYTLTHEFLRLGLAMREQSPVYAASKAELRTLARTTGELVNLVIPEADHGIYLHRVGNGEHPIPEGGQVALHASAAGKAILAFREYDAVDMYVENHGLSAITDRTVTDPETLRSELRSIRDQRIAFDRGEQTPDWQCVASPIVVGTEPIAAISVSGPADRMRGKRLEEDVTGLVVSTAKAIELELLDSSDVES
ncbi:IclR family transcriptional regulator [Natronococcus sp. A-GB1]|uniref:IclR family transcriptional regulator n=1 Tax=Natronococcus sp. A-GB1 TaxID=3037648 RepID=UPI00241F0A8B|nr:IclR family transcriptional regulator [Natronococcus sp. A-GB1]MDG5759076.1 IclR family transcriptional regulator [Natronococcus sp. A-GB1]